ncbi:MAG: DUF1893 domain-containing protein [Oscillospiraceae bacterium]|jgi:hypothetical protein|nr:DUF1893 domain-containing protein [Oscillospiraceae bacterium]
MDKKLQTVIETLRENNCTCVVATPRGKTVASSLEGVMPILQLLRDGDSLRNATVADKVVGRAAAMLLAHGGVHSVYGRVMSEGALAFLRENSIAARCETLVPVILNADGTDVCPLEKRVAKLRLPIQAFLLFDALMPRRGSD